MGAKTKQVGGGAATGVANDWNSFLRQQLNNTQQPQMQSNNAFGNAFNQAMSGQVQDNSGAYGAVNNLIKDPSSLNANTNFGNMYNAPTLDKLGTNFGAGQTGMANLSGFGTAAQSNFNFDPINSQFTNQIGGLMNSGMNSFNSNTTGGFSAAQTPADVALAQGMSYGDAYNTMGQDPLYERNKMKAAADLRARFGAEGAGSLGTGAQFAESNLAAEMAAQDASMRRQQALALMGQDLNERSTGANVGLQNRGQNVQTAIANMQGGLQGAQNRNAMFNSLSNLASTARGQDLNTLLQQQQMGAQQSMFNAGQRNDMQGQMLNANLQNQQLGNNFGLSAAQLNNAAMQNNNLNAMNNAQNTAQFGQAANQLNSVNQTNNAQNLLNLLQQGGMQNQLGNANMMQMLQGMFNNFQQSNALGTPQAQMVTQPSGWGQALNAGLGLAGAALGGPLGGMIGSKIGGMFGGGGGGSAMLPNGIGGGGLSGMPNFNIGNFNPGGTPTFNLPNFQLPQSLGGR